MLKFEIIPINVIVRYDLKNGITKYNWNWFTKAHIEWVVEPNTTPFTIEAPTPLEIIIIEAFVIAFDESFEVVFVVSFDGDWLTGTVVVWVEDVMGVGDGVGAGDGGGVGVGVGDGEGGGVIVQDKPSVESIYRILRCLIPAKRSKFS